MSIGGGLTCGSSCTISLRLRAFVYCNDLALGDSINLVKLHSMLRQQGIYPSCHYSIPLQTPNKNNSHGTGLFPTGTWEPALDHVTYIFVKCLYCRPTKSSLGKAYGIRVGWRGVLSTFSEWSTVPLSMRVNVFTDEGKSA